MSEQFESQETQVAVDKDMPTEQEIAQFRATIRSFFDLKDGEEAFVAVCGDRGIAHKDGEDRIEKVVTEFKALRKRQRNKMRNAFGLRLREVRLK